MGYRDHQEALRARVEALETRLQSLDQDAEATRAELLQAQSELAALQPAEQQRRSRLFLWAAIAAAILVVAELDEVLGGGGSLGWYRFRSVIEALCLGLLTASFFRLRRLVDSRLAAITGSLYLLAAFNITAWTGVFAGEPLSDGVLTVWGISAILLYIALWLFTALTIWKAHYLPRWLRLTAPAVQFFSALFFALRHWLARLEYTGMYGIHRLSEAFDALAFVGVVALFWYSRVSPEPADAAPAVQPEER